MFRVYLVSLVIAATVAGMAVDVCVAEPIDTTIYAIQSERDPETQASLWVGSVVRVAGIVTCDYGVTGNYNFFLEMKQGGPWSGIMVYVPQQPAGCFEVDVGDSLIIVGTVLEYYGNTEIRIDDTTQVERCGTTSLPPVAVISAAHLDTSLSSSLYEYQPDSAEAYEGVLVQIRNAFVTDTMDANGNWEISDGYGYATVLNNYTYTPQIGDLLNVTGIVHTHYDLYKIRPRSIDDIEILSAARLSMVYSTSRTGIDVKFSHAVDPTTASDPTNYQIIPELNITSAEADPQDSSLVHLTTELQTDALLCTLIVDGVEDIGGAIIHDTATFYSGFVPIRMIQTDTVPGDPYYATQWDGRLVTITGIITGESECFYNPAWYWIQQGDGPWSGIMAYHPAHPYTTVRGDSVIIAGEIDEYNGMTEITNVVYYHVVSSGNPLPEPAVINTGDLNVAAGASAEQWEAVLVKIDSAVVISVGGYTWRIDDGSGQCMVGNMGAYSYVPDSGDIVSVTGVTRFVGGNFNLYPRDDSDITVITGLEETRSGKVSFTILSNPVFTSTRVLLTLPSRSYIELSLYNVAGQCINNLKRGVFGPGTYAITLDMGDIPSGIYFCRLKVGTTSFTRKLVVMR